MLIFSLPLVHYFVSQFPLMVFKTFKIFEVVRLKLKYFH